MTHFAVLVLIPPEAGEVEAAVEKILAPTCENDEWGREGSRWDWWVVGGRYTGLLDATYDPTIIPENSQLCGFCENGHTTQAVADKYPAYQEHVGKTCIQCKGTTRLLKFGGWVPFEGDVVPVTHIDMDRVKFPPMAVVTPDGKWHEQVEDGVGMFATDRGPRKSDDAWAREWSRVVEENRDKIAVVVDCHV